MKRNKRKQSNKNQIFNKNTEICKTNYSNLKRNMKDKKYNKKYH